MGKITKVVIGNSHKLRSYDPGLRTASRAKDGGRDYTPWDPRLLARYRALNRAVRKQKDYTYSRIKGMAIHEAINHFKENGLERVIARIGEDDDPVKLWHSMKYYAFLSLLACCDNMILGNFPEVKYHKEEIVYEGMRAMESHLGTVFNRIVYRLNLGHPMDQVLLNYIQVLQEKSLFYTIDGLKIFFKPDWVEFDPDSIFLVDFKTGVWNDKHPIPQKDRMQVMLFGYLLEKRFYPKVVNDLTVHYLGNDMTWSIPFSNELRYDARTIINKYIQHNRK